MKAETNLHPLMAQALAAFAPPQSEVHRIPVAHINDDDIYEFDADTLELFAQHSPRRTDLVYLLPVGGPKAGVGMLHNGHSLARGMKVKHLGLWMQRKASDSVPAFLMREVA